MSHKHTSSDSANSKAPQHSRRKLIKSVAVGGGVVATSASLPTTWTKPVLDQVILPSHAQTSMPAITGTFATGAELGLKLDFQNFNNTEQFAQKEYDLLDKLINTVISPAEAGTTDGLFAAEAFCGQTDSGSSDSTLFIRINESGMVELALNELTGSDPNVCTSTSTIAGTTIADADIQISNRFVTSVDDANVEETAFFVRLTNMVASASQVTGNYATMINDQTVGDGGLPDDATLGLCSGTFTAALGGTFPLLSPNSESCEQLD